MSARIPLYGRDHQIRGYAVVDDDMVPELSRFPWHMASNGYAQRTRPLAERESGLPCRELMHRQIAGLSPGDGLVVDHINGDKLDNRRLNLRVCTHAENQQNRRGGWAGSTSRFRGVSWHRTNRKWVAMVKLDGRVHNLGGFDTEEEAAAVASAFRAEHMPFSEDARAAA